MPASGTSCPADSHVQKVAQANTCIEYIVFHASVRYFWVRQDGRDAYRYLVSLSQNPWTSNHNTSPKNSQDVLGHYKPNEGEIPGESTLPKWKICPRGKEAKAIPTSSEQLAQQETATCPAESILPIAGS